MISDLKYSVFPALPTVFDFDNKNPDSFLTHCFVYKLFVTQSS